MLKAIIDVMKLSVVVIGTTVVAPAAISSGHGTEAAAIGIGVMLVWFVIRVLFGKDDADEYLDEVKQTKSGRR